MGSKIQLSVEDNGIGIPSEMQNSVFSMFFRASEKSYGSGLGLYILKETEKKLGGTVEMYSVPGKFTKFIVELPDMQERIPV